MTNITKKEKTYLRFLNMNITKKDLRDLRLNPNQPIRITGPAYNFDAVDKAIQRDSRIKPAEAKTIHRLLKGRK